MVSGQIGMIKPDPAIFHYARTRMGDPDPRSVLFIDASREFRSGKNQNQLTTGPDSNIAKIVATYHARATVDKYAYRATLSNMVIFSTTTRALVFLAGGLMLADRLTAFVLLLPFALGNAAVTGAVYGATEIVIATVGVGVGGGTSGKIS